MKIASHVVTLICDDVREEKGNKISLMGIYHHSIIVATVPVTLPKLCVCVILDNLRKKVIECALTVNSPGAKPVSIPFKRKNLQIGTTFNMMFHLYPFVIKDLGEITFEVNFGKEKNPSVIYRVKVAKDSEHPSSA